MRSTIILVIPAPSFPVLVTARLLQIAALGAFCTADASLIVFLLGPHRSRPFTMVAWESNIRTGTIQV